MNDPGCPKALPKPVQHHRAHPLPMCTCNSESRVVLLAVPDVPDPQELTVVRYYVDTPQSPPTTDNAQTWLPPSLDPLPPVLWTYVGGVSPMPPHPAPEIDPSGCISALTMLAMALTIAQNRR